MLKSVTAPEFNTKFSMCVCFVCACTCAHTPEKDRSSEAAAAGSRTLGMELKSSGKVVLSPAPWV